MNYNVWLLFGMVLSVWTCWFHSVVTLPPWPVSTDFGTCSYLCFCPIVPLFPYICRSVVVHTLYRVFLCTVLLLVWGMPILYGLLSHQTVGNYHHHHHCHLYAESVCIKFATTRPSDERRAEYVGFPSTTHISLLSCVVTRPTEQASATAAFPPSCSSVSANRLNRPAVPVRCREIGIKSVQMLAYIGTNLTLYSLVVTFFTTRFNVQQFYVLSTQCIYVFCVDLRTNSDYFPIQH